MTSAGAGPDILDPPFLFRHRCRQVAAESRSRQSDHRRRGPARGVRRASRRRARGASRTTYRFAPASRSPMRWRRPRASVPSRFSRIMAVRTRRWASHGSRSTRARMRVDPARRTGHARLLRSDRHRRQQACGRSHHPQTIGVRAGRSVPAQRDRADPAADRRARALQVGRDSRAEHRQPARSRAHAHYGGRGHAMEVESRSRVRGGRASRRRRAHQPSERARLGGARRPAGPVSRIERTAEVAFTQADTWHPALSFSLQARHQEIDETAFFVLSRGGQAAASWQWTKELSSTVSYAIAREESDVDPSLDPLLGLQDGLLNAWSMDIDHRRVTQTTAPCARPFAARRAGRRMDARHLQLLQRHRRGAPLSARSDDRVVFASRLRLGSIDPMGGEAEIPLLKRFFLGGSNEMRGWGIYELSPLSASGEPVGGMSLLTATAEARVPIFKRLRGAVFVEAGNVWQDPWTMRLGDLRYDAGPGLRFDTPFGLIRVDFGYQLRPLDGLRIDGQPQRSRWRFNFGIGEAF